MLVWEAQKLPRSSLWRATELLLLQVQLCQNAVVQIFSGLVFSLLFFFFESIYFTLFTSSSSSPSLSSLLSAEAAVKETLAWEQHGKAKGFKGKQHQIAVYYFISMEEQSIV